MKPRGDDANLDRIAERFRAFEKQGDWQTADRNDEAVRRLSRAIEQAEQILVDIDPCGNVGIIASQTSLYLAMALRQRARCHFRLSLQDDQAAQSHARQALADSARAVDVVRRWGWDGERGLSFSQRNLCLRTLGLYTQAIKEAEEEATREQAAEAYLALAHCYWETGDQIQALAAATRAIQSAHNDSYRRQAWQARANFYRALGDVAAAERDQQRADTYGARLR